MSDESTIEKRNRAWRALALSTASSLALSMSMGAAAYGQEDQGPDAEEAEDAEQPRDVITVTGIRSSLMSAQDIKQDADTFLDAITAEDIGALADRSVAEALQRVPGVNISRFAQGADPDRFSVEGSGVIVRGLPFVRSELNGRDVFSATGGRNLSFNDVSPELLGSIEVFKNATADMVDGGISGTVNLVTRKPLDNPGPQLAGTVEANYGDMAEEWAPGFSVLGSNSWETRAGTFGFQLGYAQSELLSRADASQVTDPCYRAPSFDAPCIRATSVNDAGVTNVDNFDASNFPPADAVLVPKGAGVRTTDFDRDRNAISGVAQWESNDGRFLATLEYLRAESNEILEEFAILALVNDDNLFPVQSPGTSWETANGAFQRGVLTQFAGAGIPTEMLRFNQESEAVTEDLAFTVQWNPTDRLSLNFEAQTIESTRDANGIIQVMQTASDISLDATTETPVVEFLPPSAGTGGANYFTDADESFYWFLLDNQVRNEGELDSFRADAEYDFEDRGFLRSARFGARWADRQRVTRDANFANWGNLSAPWSGSAQFSSDFPDNSGVRSPFQDFQRGEVPLPVPNGAGIFFGSDDPIGDYLDGTTEQAADDIVRGWENSFGWPRDILGPFPTAWAPISARGNLVPGTNYTSSEISDVGEETLAFYGRADFGQDDLFGNGWVLEGNIGLRYVETTIQTGGQIGFPSGTPPTVSGTFCDPATVPPGASLPGFCNLSPERTTEFEAAYTGETIDDSSDIEFENWLPSLNATLEVREGMLFRFAVSKGISRPDLAAFRTGGALADNTGDLQSAGALESGPLFQISTGNRLLTPIESTNYDLSFEYYFDEVGSFTFSLFRKDLEGLITQGAVERTFTSPSGVSVVAEVNGPANANDGVLTGFELAYQDVYEFLPGPLGNLGTQLTYTYVDADDLDQPTNDVPRQPFSDGLPLAGVSEHTINAVVFYEDERHAARLAYNWRSEYTITPRDVIFPFNPIIGEDTGQLDGSYFYTINDRFKVGVQGVNLLDEVTRTSQIVDFDQTQFPRSAFRSDRRVTLVGRFNF